MMIRKPISRRWHWVLGLISLAALGLGYTAMSNRATAKNPTQKHVPSWIQLYEESFKASFFPDKYTKKIPIWEDAKLTLYRLVWGLGVAVAIALPLGLLMGCFPVFQGLFFPLLAFLAKVPPTGVLVLFFVLFTLGLDLYIAMIGFGLVPVLTQQVSLAARDDVPEELLFKARTLGANEAECVWYVIAPQVLPKIIDAVRLSLGPAIVYLIAAEVQASDTGLGGGMRRLKQQFDYGSIYLYLVALAMVGLLLDWGLIALQRTLSPWYGGEAEAALAK
jgi:NitT/TauT family transport system permease protein